MDFLDRRNAVLNEIKTVKRLLSDMERKPSRARRLTMWAQTAAALSRASELASFLNQPIDADSLKDHDI